MGIYYKSLLCTLLHKPLWITEKIHNIDDIYTLFVHVGRLQSIHYHDPAKAIAKFTQ